MSGYLIKDTTKEERIALIRSWQEPDDCVGGSGMDLFDMYDAYIRGGERDCRDQWGISGILCKRHRRLRTAGRSKIHFRRTDAADKASCGRCAYG